MIEFCFLILFILSNSCEASKLEDSVYFNINEKALSYCNVRVSDANLNAGCSSERNGNVGMLQDLAQYKILSKTVDYNVIIYVTIYEFIKGLPDNLLNDKYVKGLIVMKNSLDTFVPYSEYEKAGYSSLFPHLKIESSIGNGNAFKPWPVPIVYIDDDNTIDSILKCYNSSINATHKCALEIQDFAATKNFKDCHKKDERNSWFSYTFSPFYFCEAMYGQNYLISSRLDFTNQMESNTIIIYVRLDSLSMFERSGFNNNGVILSTSIFMSVIKLLKASPIYLNPSIQKKDFMFLFLDNTARGNNTMQYFYKTLNDSVENHKLFGLVNFTLSKVDYIMEIGELFRVSDEIQLVYSKWNENTDAATRTKNLVQRLKTVLNHFKFKVTENGTNSPQNLNNTEKNFPKSFMVITNKGNQSNKINNLTNALQEFLYKEITGESIKLDDYKDSLIDPRSIYECFTTNISCPLFLESLSETFLNSVKAVSKLPVPTQHHYGSRSYPANYRFSYLIKNPLIMLSSPVIKNLKECKDCKVNCSSKYLIIKSANNKTICYNVTNFNQLYLDDYQWLISNVVGSKSVRMFYMELYQNPTILIVGIVITVIPAILMMLMYPNIHLLFGTPLNNERS